MRVTTNDFQSRLSDCFGAVREGSIVTICASIGEERPIATLRPFDKLTDSARTGVRSMSTEEFSREGPGHLARNAGCSSYVFLVTDAGGPFATLTAHKP